MTITSTIHLLLHVLVPALVAWFGYRKTFAKAFLIMLAGMLIDVDHLLATPMYDPNRCSVGFHPLHTTPPIVLYVVLAFVPATRLFGLGLVIHIALDLLDCGAQSMLRT